MRVAVFVAVVCLSAVGLCAGQDVQASIRKSTNIPAQELVPALKTLARERGLHVVFLAEVVGTARTQGAVGDLTTTEALTRLLEGTSLGYSYLDDKTVTIVPVSSNSKSDGQDPSDYVGSYSQGNRILTTRIASAADVPVTNSPVDSNSREEGTAGVLLEEVVVTARKTAERLIDTPQSVTALTGADLQRLNALRFRDFANTVPALTFTSVGEGQTQITLRGVTSGADISPTVGVYVDDVPYGGSTVYSSSSVLALDLGLFDLQRIEILRGPQGTLYGASTMGGLIKYVTQAPSTAGVHGGMQAGVADTWGGGIGYNGAAAVNVPLAPDKAALRASGYFSRDGGLYDNLAMGQPDVDRSNTYGGRLDLLLTPIDGLSVRLGGFLQDIHRKGAATADFTSSGQPIAGSYDQSRLYPEPFDQKFRLGSATVTYDFGAAQLTSITSYQTVETFYRNDLSAVYGPLLGAFGVVRAAIDQTPATHKFTQEVRLGSTGEHTLRWLIGGFYTGESTSFGSNVVVADGTGRPLPLVLANANVPSHYAELAGFGNLSWRITDALEVSGGARVAHNNQRFEQIGTGLLVGSLPLARSKDTVETYLADARYKINEHNNVYARFATGYRPGGPNTLVVDPTTGERLNKPTFDSDSLKSYEIGAKGESDERVFGYEVSGYRINWSDIQLRTVVGPASVIANGRRARINGAELTFTARPVRDLTLTSGFAYQDARLVDASTALGGQAGERLPNVPRFTESVTADYRYTASQLQPSVGASLRFNSDRTTSYSQNLTIPQYMLPSYTSFDLRSGVMLGSWALQAYVHNLFDRAGQLSASATYASLGGPVQVGLLERRTVGLSVTTEF
ncbi:MAG: TonB-dependent receptor [Proteobacteria bacterium]|nr:TonB-dependent receptor [Pseudomonadota bacterium]